MMLIINTVQFLISQTKNVALGGAGNRRIARTVLENPDDSIKAVVVMWSTIRTL